MLAENLEYYLNLYDIWSSYRPEEEGVMIAYTSVYGHTKQAVLELAALLEQKGCPKVVVNDLARCDMAEAVEDAFRYSKLVLATTTYNGGIFPFMQEFIHHLTERNFQNRTVAMIENGSWGPTAVRVMTGMLEKSKNLSYLPTKVKIMSALNEESRAQLQQLAEELCGSAQEAPVAEEASAPAGEKYVCNTCCWVYNEEKGLPARGIAPGTKFADLPEDFTCPLCKMGKDHFEKLEF